MCMRQDENESTESCYITRIMGCAVESKRIKETLTSSLADIPRISFKSNEIYYIVINLFTL